MFLLRTGLSVYHSGSPVNKSLSAVGCWLNVQEWQGGLNIDTIYIYIYIYTDLLGVPNNTINRLRPSRYNAHYLFIYEPIYYFNCDIGPKSNGPKVSLNDLTYYLYVVDHHRRL